MIKWFNSNPHINLTKHISDCQEHRSNDTDKEKYKLINQEVKTTNDQYYITHQQSTLSNTVTENDIYNNYSYTLCMNWEIEKTSETPSKKLKFNINKPGTGLKMTDFNIVTKNDEIGDMNKNKMVCPSDNLTNDVNSKIDHQNVQQKQATHNSPYTFVNYKLQLCSDLEDPNGNKYWKNTNSHKSELIIAYNNTARDNTLHPKVFYALYIKTIGNNNGHLIYDPLRGKIAVTTDYQLVPVPVDQFEPTNRTESSNNKIQVDHFDIKQSII